MHSPRFRVVITALVLLACVFGARREALGQTYSYRYTGFVQTLELWASGNVAFRLSSAVGTCNGQFVLNVSSPGTRNLYAALLSAKLLGRQVEVLVTTCGAAEGYSGTGQYNLPAYVYILD